MVIGHDGMYKKRILYKVVYSTIFCDKYAFCNYLNSLSVLIREEPQPRRPRI